MPPSVRRAKWALAADGDRPATMLSSPAGRALPSISAHSMAARPGSASSAPIRLKPGKWFCSSDSEADIEDS
jgi:hypothetical protein